MNGDRAMAAGEPDARATEVLILGIGNILWADEGFGVRCVERLNAEWWLPPSVRLIDGGTQGLLLVPDIMAAARVIVFDAVDYGAPPATLLVVRDREVPVFIGQAKMSLHQAGFEEVLACADLLGGAPDRVTLIGCQPEELEDYGGSLRASVAARLDEAVALAVAELRAWGVVARRRQAGEPASALFDPSLGFENYAAGRPSAHAACRVGDARFLLDRPDPGAAPCA